MFALTTDLPRCFCLAEWDSTRDNHSITATHILATLNLDLAFTLRLPHGVCLRRISRGGAEEGGTRKVTVWIALRGREGDLHRER